MIRPLFARLLRADGRPRAGRATSESIASCAARASRSLAVTRTACASGVVLRLREKVRRDPVRARRVVRDDHHLGGPGEKVDTDVAVHELFRLGDVLIARADDHVHPGHARGPVGHRGDCLSAADGEHTVDATQRRGRKDPLIAPGKRGNSWDAGSVACKRPSHRRLRPAPGKRT